MHSLFGRLRALAATDVMSLGTPQKPVARQSVSQFVRDSIIPVRRTLLQIILERTVGRTVAAGVDTCDGELGGVAGHRTALQRDLAVHGRLVARQDQA